MAKLTVEFSDGMTKLLESLARKNGTTKVDVIRRALALYNYVDEEVLEKKGRKLSITEDDNKVIKDLIVR